MAKYLKLEYALNKIATGGKTSDGPFYQSAGAIEQMAKTSNNIDEFIDKLAGFIEDTIKK